MQWFKRLLKLFRKPSIKPDLEKFNSALKQSINVEFHDGQQVARDFRRLFNNDPECAKRVLFMIMTWCGEYDSDIPEDNNLLQRRAGKQEVAWQIKAALNANIDDPLSN